MIKKLLSVLFVAACVFGATSCTSDEFTTTQSGDQATVSFSLGLEGGIDTRAISDGSGADVLQYAVFNADGDRISTIAKVSKTGVTFPTTENITLAKGQTYKIAFWAQDADCQAYTVSDDMNVEINYAGVNNDETRDAFFKSIEFTVTGSTSIDVILKRPFAQINVGVYESDWNAAVASGVEIEKSTATIVKAANTINLLTGKVGEETTDVTVGYTENAIPTEALMVDLDKNGTKEAYKWLSMSYILVADHGTTANAEGMFGAAATTLEDLGFSFIPKNGANAITFAQGLTSVPVQRNWRTNIIGKLLTGDITFNIDIDPIYDGDHNIEGLSYVASTNTYYVSTPEALMEMSDIINNNDDTSLNNVTVTISLEGDIDLAGLSTRAAVSNWTPIGTSENPFTGTFNGNGYKIKNLTIVEEEAKEGKAYIGFFGYAKDAVIKNVTFENVNLNIACLDIDHSQGHIGAVAGSLEGTSTIENVTVQGDIKVESTVTANGASRVAVVAGGNSYGNVTMKNVHVKANAGSYLKANNNVGALAGQLQGKSVFENCTSNIDVTGTKFFAGGIIGLAAGDQVFTNCHTTGNVTITQGREGKAHDHFRVGGIAGGWADGPNKVCTLTGCTYTGVVSGKSFEGVEADPLDYMGYVGRGYTINGCQGSTVIIDGISFVQKSNTAAEAGVYIVNGVDSPEFVETADELIENLENGNNVFLTEDVKINPAGMSNAYGTTGINVKNGQTIDGNGHILDIKGAGGTWDSGISTTGGLIKNITVTGSFRGIFINHNSTNCSKVILEKVKTTGTVYTISCDQGTGNGLEATDCEFYGWTSYAKTLGDAKFVNCKFGEGSGYAYCRPYAPTVFVGCAFEAGFTVDPVAAVTFENCTFGGVPVTAANVAELVTSTTNVTVK